MFGHLHTKRDESAPILVVGSVERPNAVVKVQLGVLTRRRGRGEHWTPVAPLCLTPGEAVELGLQLVRIGSGASS